MRAILILACLSLPMSGCGVMRSTVGSLGFGGGVAQAKSRADLPNLVPAGARRAAASDPRQLAGGITGAELTPTTSGGLLRVSIRPQGTGAYNVDLVPSGRSADTLRFDAKLQLQAAGGASPARVSAARALTRGELAGVRRIQIRSAAGITTIRR